MPQSVSQSITMALVQSAPVFRNCMRGPHATSPAFRGNGATHTTACPSFRASHSQNHSRFLLPPPPPQSRAHILPSPSFLPPSLLPPCHHFRGAPRGREDGLRWSRRILRRQRYCCRCSSIVCLARVQRGGSLPVTGLVNARRRVTFLG